MNTKLILCAATLLGITTASWCAPRPNIVFFISDDHAFQALGSCDKDSPVPYPHLHRLADQGMVFDRSYCANSLCGPSRACILTGRHTHQNGFFHNCGSIFDGRQPTYPKMLKKVGYTTAYIGKWHLESDPTGFDRWDILTGQGWYYNPDFLEPNPKTGKRIKTTVPGYVSDIITEKAIQWLDNRDKNKPFAMVIGHKAPHRPWFPAPRHLGKAKKYVAKLPLPETLYDNWENRPKFLSKTEQRIAKDFSLWSDNHILPPRLFDNKEIANLLKEELGTDDLSPYIMPQPYVKKMLLRFQWLAYEINRMDREQKKAWLVYHAKRTRELIELIRAGKLDTEKQRTEWRWRTYMEDYLGTILAVDDSVGRITDYLKEHGLDKNTLVVYCGDQGFYLGEHGLYDKRWIFEESFRMPLIMSWPGTIPAGVRSQAMVQNIDYAPTFCELAGVKDPAALKSFQGTSFASVLKTGMAPGFADRPLYYAYYENPGEHNCPRQDGFRTQRYTYGYISTSDEYLLIDNEKDPLQLKNVYSDPAYADVVKKMKKIYLDLRAKYQVPDALPGGKGAKNVNDLKKYKATWNR